MSGNSSTRIPDWSRALVRKREHERCMRCPAPGCQWHHRRGRSVVGEHRHCPCNGVWLCHACHTWVHAHPELAMIAGFIVSRTITEPGNVPVLTFRSGPIYLACDGLFQHQPNGELSDDEGGIGS